MKWRCHLCFALSFHGCFQPGDFFFLRLLIVDAKPATYVNIEPLMKLQCLLNFSSPTKKALFEQMKFRVWNKNSTKALPRQTEPIEVIALKRMTRELRYGSNDLSRQVLVHVSMSLMWNLSVIGLWHLDMYLLYVVDCFCK